MTDPSIAPSARKHGVSDDDMLHAYRCAMRAEDENDGLIMLIGPSRSGALLEVGVIRSEFGPVIVHAMAARSRYLRW
ncbi:hypothetical protein [Jiangella rhizosphaerae]|uniref:Toxin n=1 Tax=Jiangella rhizosphaerae TaxID=2293569 RepID=A0A418KW81_9ACTN|nr:hypothetical protein [Jiangella rhizosphaerae]RIQ34941.1 hypothetical protein DY240_02770 [Jiangella rhizosphaerae]